MPCEVHIDNHSRRFAVAVLNEPCNVVRRYGDTGSRRQCSEDLAQSFIGELGQAEKAEAVPPLLVLRKIDVGLKARFVPRRSKNPDAAW